MSRKTVKKINSTEGEAAPLSESSDEAVPKKQCTTIEKDLCCMCFGSYSDYVIG